jgi:inorganic pyrophosphatase
MNDTVTVFIEIPSGSRVKYSAEKGDHSLWFDEILSGNLRYPENYGFLEGTKGEDGKELDAFVLTSEPLASGTHGTVRIIGAILATDEKGFDPKFLTVPQTAQIDPICGAWQDLAEIPKKRLETLTEFVLRHKENKSGKWVKIDRVIEKEAAMKVLEEGRNRDKK